MRLGNCEVGCVAQFMLLGLAIALVIDLFIFGIGWLSYKDAKVAGDEIRKSSIKSRYAGIMGTVIFLWLFLGFFVSQGEYCCY